MVLESRGKPLSVFCAHPVTLSYSLCPYPSANRQQRMNHDSFIGNRTSAIQFLSAPKINPILQIFFRTVTTIAPAT